MGACTIVYALEEAPDAYERSVFLAGPTPRSADIVSWRPEVIALLQQSGFDGVVFVPEQRSGEWHGDETAQIDWEDRYLNMADCILFWVPRNTKTLPGFTTNVEFGRWADSGKVVFGAPDDAVKNNYLRHYAKEFLVPQASTLADTVGLALKQIGDGAARSGGSREVPLYVWRTPSFQQWYQSQVGAGNRLDHARVVCTFRVGPDRQIMFLWVLHVDVYVKSEDRHKSNEVVLSRPDISSVLLYRRADNLDDSKIVVVKEFRSTVSNSAGFVFEAAGGSSFNPGGNPWQVAADEVHEELGLIIPAERFYAHEARQLNATFSAHKAHLFSVEVADAELAQLRTESMTAHGNTADGERTYPRITTLGNIRGSDTVDWAMLGMIMQVLTPPRLDLTIQQQIAASSWK